MSASLREMLKDCAVVFDVDGVLAAYEFGENCHYAPIWEEAFVSETDNPYMRVNPLPVLQKFISQMERKKVFVCSVASDFERRDKRNFVLRNYEIPAENIFFVEKKQDKLKALMEIGKAVGGSTPVAIVDDTVKTLDGIYEQGGFITVHVTSFFD